MGDHYIPKYYLKGFSSDDGRTIWVYDKREQRRFATPVKNVANQNRFYSRELESYLTEDVEEPTKPVLRKIKTGVQISIQEKQTLAAYMISMMMRVPQGRKRMKQVAPSVADKVRREVDRQLDSALLEDPKEAELVEKRRYEAHGMIDRYTRDPPDDLWFRIIPPDKWQRALAVLSNMTWLFLTFDQYPAFLTSDNPFFYFTERGFSRPDAEVTFPISSHVALWATQRRDLAEGFFPARLQVVKELNRRTASTATRYVFHSTDEAWVLRLLTQRSWRLNALQ